MQEQRKTFAINSWHLNDFESDAFWKIYSRMDEGIVIKSTVGRLKKALNASKRTVYVSKVKYIDFDNDIVSTDNAFWAVVHKRNSFVHENELRAFIWEVEATKDVPKSDFMNKMGDLVKLDIRELIGEIIVSPKAPEWFYNDVQELTSKLRFNFKITQSKLFEVGLR